MDRATFAETKRRTAINEGCRLTRYRDSLGIWTIAYGLNLTRPDAASILTKAGVADPQAVIAGTASLTQAQADNTLAILLPGFIDDAAASLNAGVFDALAPARQCVIVDLCYNLGPEGWAGFVNTRTLINTAQQAKNAGLAVEAHSLFGQAADHLLASDYAAQVGDRAKRNAAMLRTSSWCSATGDGSDVL